MIKVTDKGNGDITFKEVCMACGKELDKSLEIVVPGATPEEVSRAEVIAYARFFPEVGFGDIRRWCGDCWRAAEMNQEEPEEEPEA